MSDTSTNPAAPTTTTPSAPLDVPTPTATSGNSTGGLADSINTAVKSAPELAKSPGLAVGAATADGDTGQNAQAVAHAANTVALGTARRAVEKSAPGGISGALDWLGHQFNPAPLAESVASEVKKEYAPGDAFTPSSLKETGSQLAGVVNDPVGSAKADASALANVVNQPLAVVQHEYRYLHDVQETHGLLAAIAASVPLAIGTVGGGLVGGGAGAVLGGEAAVGLESQVMFNGSWQRTSSSTYVDPRTGQQVSMGRDVADSLGLDKAGAWRSIIQHTVDGISQLALDPVAATGGLIGTAKSAAGLTGTKLGDLFGGLAPANAEDVDRVYSQYQSVRDAFAHIATLNAGAISRQYRDLSGVAKELGDAKTSEEVAQVFKNVIRSNELLTTSQLPTLAATRIPFKALGNAAQDATPDLPGGNLNPANLVISGVQKMSKNLSPLPRAPIIEDGAIKDYGLNVIDPSDNHGLTAFNSFLRYAENSSVADALTSQLANINDLGERVALIKNSVMDVVMHMAGYSSDADIQTLSSRDFQYFKEQLDSLMGGGEPGVSGVYGSDGLNATPPVVVGDRQIAAGLLENHTGLVTLPDLRQMRKMAAYLKGNKDLFGKADDFAYKWATQAFFKRAVLLTPSYGWHIALAELIPNGFRLGFMNLIKNGMAANMGEKTDRLAEAPELWDRATKLANEADKVEAAGKNADDIRAQANHAKKVAQANDLGPVAGGVFRLMGGTRAALPAKMDELTQQKVSFFARLYHAQDGHLTSPATSAGEHISKEFAPIDRHTDALRKGVFNTLTKERGTGSFGLYHRSDVRANDEWQSWLSEIAKSKMSRVGATTYRDSIVSGATHEAATRSAVDAVSSHLDSLDNKELRKFVRNFHFTSPTPPIGMSTHDDWANEVVRNLQGATTGTDGTVHKALLDHVINGETTPAHELDAIDEGSKPLHIKGRQMVPDPENVMQKIANWGFQHVLNPMVQFMSREPIYATEAWNEYSRQLPQVEKGLLSDDQAFVLAQSRATNNVIKNVHNLNDRTQWTVTLRNFAPFFFAQEQAYRRMGRLLASNPGAFRRYQMTISAISQFTSNMQRNGSYFAVIPGTGFLTPGVVRALGALFPGQVEGMSPMGMGWSTSSANVIFPMSDGVRPGVGPAYAVPIKAMVDFFPDFNPALKADVSGAGSALVGNVTISEDIWKQLVPNVFVQRVLEATQADDRSFSSSMMQQMIALDYLQEQAMDKWVKAGNAPTAPGHPQIIPDPTAAPDVQQQFIDRLRNGTRINYIVRALLGLVTPVSPETTVDNWGLPAALTADIQKAGDVSTGITNFLAKNPNAQAFTTFQSHFETVSGTIPASEQAESWVNDNYSLIKQFPAAAVYLMPQETNPDYSATVYNEQLAQGLRTKYDALALGNNEDPYNPNSFLDQLYVNAANHTYYDVMLPAHEAQLADANVDHTTDNAEWSAWEKSFALQNPVWASWHASGDRTIKRTDAIQQLRQIYASGKAPAGEMSDQVKGLLDQYEQYQTAYMNRDSTGQTATDLNTGWQAHLQAVKTAVPTLAPIINSVFLEATATQVPLANGAPS